MGIEELLEKEAIKEVRIKYCHYFDGRMIEELTNLFADDAVCEFGPKYGGNWVGKDQIRENFSKFAEREGPPYGVLHAVTNPWVRHIDANTANARWYLHDLRTTVGVDDPRILYGIYDDIYRKDTGEWKIHRTRIDFLWPWREFHGPRDL